MLNALVAAGSLLRTLHVTVDFPTRRQGGQTRRGATVGGVNPWKAVFPQGVQLGPLTLKCELSGNSGAPQ